MDQIFTTIRNIWKIENLRRKFLVTLLVLGLFRVLAHIPLPGINTASLKQIFAGSQLLSLLDIFSGGTLANFSIMALGVNPYINASIILQMLTMVFPKLEELSQEGEYGREKINQYTRLLTLPLAFMQSFGLIALLKSQQLAVTTDPFQLLTLVVTLSAGTILLMWLGELLTEYGIGNGISMIIFAGIAGRLPISLFQTAATSSSSNLTNILVFAGLSLAVIYLVVKTTEATRQITIQYARRLRSGVSTGGQMTHLPLRLNQAGVIPIIFAVSLMLFPSMIGNFLLTNPQLSHVGRFLNKYLAPDTMLYATIYFFLVIAFTYFYTSVVFNPEKIADQVKKNGGFIPGIRPGKPTSQYLGYVLNRITIAGAVFLGFIAVMPNIAQKVVGISTLAIGGTGMLIVVSVILETAKDIESQLVMRHYDKFL